VQKIAKEKNKLILVSGAASTRITNEGCNDITVHWTYDTYALANGTAKVLVKQGGKSWFFLTVDYVFGHSLEKDATDVILANGGTVVGSVRHPFPETDFSPFPAEGPGLGRPGDRAGQLPATTRSTRSSRQSGSASRRSSRLAGLLVFITDVHSLGLKMTQGMYLTEGF